MISSALCRACRLLPTGERILNFCEEYPSRFLHRFGLSAQSFQLGLFILQREFDLVKATPFKFKQGSLFRKIIKKFQRDTNIIFIVISSFNRANYMQSVSFKNFKESGNIEYTADIVWALQLNILDSIYPAKQLIVSNDRASKKIFNLTLDDLHDWIAQHKPIDFLEIQRHKKFGEIISTIQLFIDDETFTISEPLDQFHCAVLCAGISELYFGNHQTTPAIFRFKKSKLTIGKFV